MLCLAVDKPFLPWRPIKTLTAELNWWKSLLESSFIGRNIPRPLTLHDPAAFSDASSGTGIAIIIGDRWRAWHLRKGWQTLDGAKDIGWVETVRFELLIQHLIEMGGSERNFRVYGDNQGVIEGWNNRHSRHLAVNSVFRRIFSLIHDSVALYSFHPTYITSKTNPADTPSRGIYSSTKFPLPTFPIPSALQPFIVDPFCVSTNPVNYSSGKPPPSKPERTPCIRLGNHSLSREQTITDSLYLVHERQQCDHQ